MTILACDNVKPLIIAFRFPLMEIHTPVSYYSYRQYTIPQHTASTNTYNSFRSNSSPPSPHSYEIIFKLNDALGQKGNLINMRHKLLLPFVSQWNNLIDFDPAKVTETDGSRDSLYRALKTSI